MSRPASIFMIVTPVSASPLRMAHWIGAAPRYLGSREVWTLRQPKRGRSRMLCGQNLAIGRHRDQVRLQVAQGAEEGLVARAFGLEDREAGLQREFLHRRRLQLQVPSLGPVRLRDDGHDLETAARRSAPAGCRTTVPPCP